MNFIKSIFPSQQKVFFPDELLDHDASKLNYVVIDCEMTGLNPRKDKLLSVAAVKVLNGRILVDSAFYEVIRQDLNQLKTETILIHRLNHDLIANGNNEQVVIDELYKFCDGCIPVGHFFDIDLSFLPKNNQFSFPHLDTRKLAEYVLKRQTSSSDLNSKLHLEKLVNRFSLPKFTAHNALSDACTTACLFLKLIHLLKHHRIITLKSFNDLQ